MTTPPAGSPGGELLPCRVAEALGRRAPSSGTGELWCCEGCGKFFDTDEGGGHARQISETEYVHCGPVTLYATPPSSGEPAREEGLPPMVAPPPEYDAALRRALYDGAESISGSPSGAAPEEVTPKETE